MPVMGLDNGGTDCKSQARARGWSPTCPRQLHVLDPIELGEDRLQLVRWDPDSLIRDSHLQFLIFLLTWREHTCTNGDSAALRRVLERVLEQIAQYLLDLRMVKRHRRYIVGYIDHDIIPRRPTDEVKLIQHRGDDIANRIPALLGHGDASLQSREVEQICHQAI